MRTKLLFLLFAVFSSINIKAQYSISGNVVSGNDIPIQYINVQLLNGTDSTFILAQSFEGTKFEITNIAQSQLIVSISSLGFEEIKKRVEFKTPHLDLGKIYIKEKILGEVMVKASRPLIKRTTDGLVFDVANSYYSKGYNGVELLSRTPNLSVSDQGVNVIGRSGVLVLINGKQTHMTGPQIIGYLKTIDSKNIREVIVSTNPSSKYEAQGNSGVVNIILKKEEGFNLDVDFTYRQAKKSSFIPTVGFSYSNDKLYTNLNISSFWENKVSNSDLQYIYPDYVRTVSTERNDKSNPNIYTDLTVDYKLTNRSNIGIISSLNINRGESQYSSKSDYSNYNSVYKTLNMPSFSDDNHNYFSIYPYWDFKIDSLGRKFQIEAGYVKSKSDKDIQLSLFSLTQNTEITEFSVNNSNLEYELYTIKGDFILPFQKYGTLEFGAKSLFIRNESVREAYSSDENFEEVIGFQDNLFKTDEDIHAIYTSYALKLFHTLSLRSGLRYEYTINKNNIGKKNSYGNLFPSVSLSYQINESLSANVGYNKRINRPSISQVNPFRWYTNSIDYQTGNIDLKPEIMHNINLGISQGSFSADLYTTILNSGIEYISDEDFSTKGYSSYPINSLKETRYGATLNYYWMPIEKFSLLSSLNLYLYKLKSDYSKSNTSSDNGNSGSIMIRPSYTISNKWGNGLDLILMYNLPESNKIRSSSSYVYWGIRYKQSFFDDNMRLSVTVNDPFRWAKNKNRRTYADFTFRSEFYNDSQLLELTLSYSFSNKKLRNVNKMVDKSAEMRIK